uniref:PC4 domain-containing protein n=1 Tax=Meloidogyne hapla TaxID=6305 RepID=A0A1I8BKX0_MELHA
MSSSDSSIDVPVTKKGKATATRAAPAKKPAPAKAKKRAEVDSDSDSSAAEQPPPAKNQASKRKAESDESEDASSGDDEYQPAQKKETKPPQKKGKAAAKKSDSDEDVSEDEEESVKAKNGKKGGKAAAPSNVEYNADGNEIIPLGMKRFVGISSFRGQLNVDIREYFQKDGKWLPGKKGIALSQAQFFEFEKNVESTFASTSAATIEFSGVLSPLEPLDPNKFRNIMLDKQEVPMSSSSANNKTPQRLSMESLSMDSSTSNEFRGLKFSPKCLLIPLFSEKSVSLDSATPKSFHHQTAPHTPLIHSHQQQFHTQPPQSPAIQQLQQRSMSLQQHPHVQQQSQQSHLQQYFPAQPPMQQMQPQHQNQPHPFSPMQQPGQYGVSPQMIQHQPNYNMMPGHPHWIHQQHQQQHQQQIHQPPPPYQHISPPTQQQMYHQHPSLVKQQVNHQILQQQQQSVGTFMGTGEGAGNVILPQQQIPPSRFSPHPSPQHQQQHLTPSNQQRHPSSTISPEYLNYQQSQQLKPPPHYGQSPQVAGSYSPFAAGFQQQQKATLQSPTENLIAPQSHPNSLEKILRPTQMVIGHGAPGFSSPEYASSFNSSIGPTNMVYNQQHPHQPPPQRPQQMLQMQQGMIQQQTPSQALPQSLGHQQVISTPINPLNPEICLTGCVFLLIDDCSPQLVDRLDNEHLIQKALAPEYSTERTPRIPRKVQRIVTLHWLNDTIGKRKVEPPSKACHLPGFWSVLNPNPQISSKVISFFGFDQNDSNAIKFMIRSIGAFCLPINSKTDFLVINRSSLTDQIIEKCNSLNVQIVNYKWLFELYFGNINVLSPPDSQRYFPEAETLLTCVTISPQYLAKMSDLCFKLMVPWTQPILITDEITKSAYLMKRTIFEDTSIFPEKVFRITDNAPNEEQITKASAIISASLENPLNISVLFDGLTNEQVDNLSKKVRFLAGKIVESPNECTHFVTTCLRKSLKVSILRARQRKIFKDIIFHIGQGTQPSFNILRELVEAADGRVVEEKPTKKELFEYIQQFSTRISSLCQFYATKLISQKTFMHIQVCQLVH